MTRGRKPKPTSLKIVRGNPGRRPLNDKEPKAPIGCSPPSWVKGASAKAAWRRVYPKLEAAGIVTELDSYELGLFCVAEADFIRASKELEKYGDVMECEGKNGKPYFQISPWVTLRKQAEERLHKYATEFGMTPSARTRVKVQPPKRKSRLDRTKG